LFIFILLFGIVRDADIQPVVPSHYDCPAMDKYCVLNSMESSVEISPGESCEVWIAGFVINSQSAVTPKVIFYR